MNDGRNILSDDKAKALREIIEQELETGRVYVIPARGNGKTAAMKAALERAAEQAQQIKQHLTETRLTPSTEELLEGVRLPETPSTATETQLRAEVTALRRMIVDAERRARAEAYRISAKSVESTVLEKELARKRAPIIAVDFDGTLCENEWPGIGATKWETVQALIAARAAGARLILWTNRVGPRLAEAVEWCRQRELEFDAVNENLPEVRHGRWKGWTTSKFTGKYEDYDEPVFKDYVYYTCSECYRKSAIQELYCPQCGARMDGGADNG